MEIMLENIDIAYEVTVCLALIASFFIHLFVHETGHLIFGLLAGYKFQYFSVCSFVLSKIDGKLKIKRLNISGTGGYCSMFSPETADDVWRFALFFAGGSLMNIIVCTLALTLSFFCRDAQLVRSILVSCAFFGFFLAGLNVIPMRSNGVANDGLLLWTMLKYPGSVKYLSMTEKICKQNISGVCLRDMPAEWFVMPPDEALKHEMLAAEYGALVCSRVMDEDRFEEAGSMIDHLLELAGNILGISRYFLACDRLFIELTGRKRHDVVEKMVTEEFRKIMKRMMHFPQVIRTQYALAMLWDKDEKKSAELLEEFERKAKTYPNPNEFEQERKLLEIIKNKAAGSAL